MRPELFCWEGAVDRKYLEKMLTERSWALPSDLFEILALTGGGEIFESESILGPYRDPDLGDNLFTYNQELKDRGLREDSVVFHTGMSISAVKLSNGIYVELSLDDLQEQAEFSSFEDWYLRLIRAEYSLRYGLPPLSLDEPLAPNLSG